MAGAGLATGAAVLEAAWAAPPGARKASVLSRGQGTKRDRDWGVEQRRPSNMGISSGEVAGFFNPIRSSNDLEEESVSLTRGNIAQGRNAAAGRKDMPLYRSRQHKLIAGVCGGIADYLGWNPTLVRIGYVVVSIASAAFPGTIAYVVLWLVMPKEPG